MPTVKVRNLKNEEIREVELSDAVFGAPLNEGLIHAAVRNFMANARQGTSATKTGGNVHGPQPRDWSYNMPKKMRQGALRSALSERVREGKVVLIDGWTLEKPKTKDFIASLQQLGLEGRTLIVDSLDNDNLMLSTRNVQSAKVVNSFGLNIYDLLYHERLVISEAAVKGLEQLLGPKKADGAGDEAVAEEKAEAVAAKPKRARKPAVKSPKAAPKRKKEAA